MKNNLIVKQFDDKLLVYMKGMIILIISIILFTNNACTKVHKIPFPDDDNKLYSIFNPGSFWVYSDSVNNIYIDSIILLKNLYYPINRNFEFSKSEYEHLNQTYYSKKRNSNIEVDTYYGDYRSYKYNNTIGYFYSYAQFSSIDSLKVNQTWFKNIRIYTLNDTICYWSKNIGLIKKTYKNNLNLPIVLQLTNYSIK